MEYDWYSIALNLQDKELYKTQSPKNCTCTIGSRLHTVSIYYHVDSWHVSVSKATTHCYITCFYNPSTSSMEKQEILTMATKAFLFKVCFKSRKVSIQFSNMFVHLNEKKHKTDWQSECDGTILNVIPDFVNEYHCCMYL